MSDHGKNKKGVFTDRYTAGICKKILVCGWYMTVLVYKWYVKVTRMTKIENSGIQTGICGNLVYMRYTRKKAI